MTIEQKKIALINWITNLNEESVINKIETFRSETLDELPKEILTLLEMSNSTKESDCIEHTGSMNVLGRK